MEASRHEKIRMTQKQCLFIYHNGSKGDGIPFAIELRIVILKKWFTFLKKNYNCIESFVLKNNS